MTKRLALASWLSFVSAQALAAETVTSASVQSTVEPIDTRHAQAQLMHAWGLKEAEAMRYEALMRGPRGSFSVDTISPLEVLGIHAD